MVDKLLKLPLLLNETRQRFMAIFFEGSRLSSGLRAKPKPAPIGPISALKWCTVPTRIMKNMPAMQTIITRSVIIGPKNIHGEIQ